MAALGVDSDANGNAQFDKGLSGTQSKTGGIVKSRQAPVTFCEPRVDLPEWGRQLVKCQPTALDGHATQGLVLGPRSNARSGGFHANQPDMDCGAGAKRLHSRAWLERGHATQSHFASPLLCVTRERRVSCSTGAHSRGSRSLPRSSTRLRKGWPSVPSSIAEHRFAASP